MTKLYAQPYDVSATGFYFDDAGEYAAKSKALKNDYGDPVEEFEIQFIDGELIDCDFAKTLGLNQSNLVRFFELVDEWEEHDKIQYIVAVGECSYDFDVDSDHPNDFDVDIFHVENMVDLARQFVDEALPSHLPEMFQCYIDYEAFARDLAMDYSETTIAGQRMIYRCG